jgi:hypothetical protein
MKHLQKAPRKPLLNAEQGEVFISLLDDELHMKIAKKIYVDGMTREETAKECFYSKREIERIRISLLKTVLKRLIEKQIPKKPIDISKEYNGDYGKCPNCKRTVSDFDNYRMCNGCGQALNWG